MIWIPLLPVPERPQAKVGGSTLPSLLITNPQRTGGVRQVKILIIIIMFAY